MSTPLDTAPVAADSLALFEYDPSLQEYMVSEKEYLRQNPQYHVLCTGIVVFNNEGKLLLVQRAADEKAFPNFWEIPGGKVDEPDETLLHAAVRELKEEAGLTATRVVRKVAEFGWGDYNKRRERNVEWRKLIFEMEVADLGDLNLDPVEHQSYLWAGEEEIREDRVGNVELRYISPPNKDVKLAAFTNRREGQKREGSRAVDA